MSDEDKDAESKTEQATDKRLETAREKGNIPFSQELSHLGSLVGVYVFTLLVISLGVPSIEYLYIVLHNIHQYRLIEASDFLSIASHATVSSLAPLGLSIVLISAIGILAIIIQNFPAIVTSRISPDLSRISPVNGLKRLSGKQGLIEFGKTSIKFLALFSCLGLLLNSQLNSSTGVLALDPIQFIKYLVGSASYLALVALGVMLFISMLDVLVVRQKWAHDLRMTLKEVKDETKEAEGDPIQKAFRRSIALSRSRSRMMLMVPKATMVITNPTHFSVALRYDRSIDPAPIVVAKGQDLIAKRIRQIATESNVAIVENKILARALYKQVEVDQVIPACFYQAVAEIILFVQRRTGKSYV